MAAGLRPVGRLWGAYCTSLVQRPLLSRCLTGVVGGVLSDVIAQKAVRTPGGRGYDYARTARLVAYGFVVGTPIAYKWYAFLDQFIMPRHPTSPTAVLTKMLMDQLLMCPIGTVLFFIGIRTLEGRPHTAGQMLRERFVPLLKANYMVWPLVHIVNFALVPASQRILYLNVIGVLWGAWMAHVTLGPGHSSKNAGGAGGDAHCQVLLEHEMGERCETEVVALPRRTPSAVHGRRTSGAFGNKDDPP